MIAKTGERGGSEGPSEAEAAPSRTCPSSVEQALCAMDPAEALRRSARDHGPALGRLCMAFTASQAEAEELVQETLLAAFDAFSTYRGEGSLRAWLFAIA